ncbi:hypothetical protein MB14_00405 [Roseivirga ehrenbergii]|uniref:Cadherin domain-containing protein n=1 Tax=Roseivirga ehrenbergii (strain DSM 102268 / JCM 13514 / KCTC 12282 / NCIMB 14502 / KMM 6017) TaxID=279360 RepID=A0A150XSZ8_ROSEK|nr:MBG domain-containing protein [Roseivirga ehrenbergii]KYG81889.1 hypothetical protein MB14_00405 [Roseivirga ehrenbergii]
MRVLLISLIGILICTFSQSQTNSLPKLDLDEIQVKEATLIELNLSIKDDDGDPVSLQVDNLPDWLSLNKTVKMEATTIFKLNLDDDSRSYGTGKDGNLQNATGTYFLRSVAIDNEDNYYFIDGRYLRVFDGEEIKTLYTIQNKNALNIIEFAWIRFSGSRLFVSDYSRIFEFKDGELTLFVGAVDKAPGDVDGQGDQARFKVIADFISDGKDGLFVADVDSRKIKHVSSSGLVTTYAGGLSTSVDGPYLSSGFQLLKKIRLNSKGDLIVYEGFEAKLRRLRNGVVETIFPTAQSPVLRGSLIHFHLDGLGGFISLKDQFLEGYDEYGKLTLSRMVVRDHVDGDLSNMGWRTAMDISSLNYGSFLLADQTSSAVRLIKYSYEYTLMGTPPEDIEGITELTFRLNDGIGDEVTYQIPLGMSQPNTLPTVTTIPNVEEIFAVDKTMDIALFDYFSDAENSDSELTYEVVTNSDNSVVVTSVINSADGLLKLSVVNAGTTTLTLKATDTRGGMITTSFEVNIAKAEASIEFGALSFINTGEAKPVTVTTVPSGLNFTLTYAGQTSAPSAVGTYALEAVIDERNYAKVATAELAIINIAPEAMALSANTIFENSAEATLIGELSVTDQNPTDTHRYSLPTGTTDNGSFTITDAKLYASSSFNFEEKASYTVTVLVTDNHNATYQKEFMVTVTDVNEAPTIDAYAEIQVVKNLGSLSITLTDLSAGEDANQTITITSTKSGVIKSNSVTLSADKTTALLTFETETDQEGTGTIQVTVQDDGGTANGGVDTKTIDIPIKVLAPNVTVTNGSNCGSGSVSLSAAGADSYKWYAAPLGGSSLSSEATYTVDLQTSSTFYVAGVVSGTESKLRVPVSATVFDALAVPVITNTDNVLSVTAITGLSYQWMKDGVNIDEATGNSFSPTESGNYSVVISNTNNCSATSVAEEVIITGIEDVLYTLAVNVYPIPSSDYVYLEFDETLRKGTKVQMVDNSGKQLVMKVLTEATNKLTIDVRKMPEGMHTIVVQDGAKLARKKILIQR